MTVSSRNFSHIYEELGIDPNGLGCIMLDVEPIPREWVPPADWGHTEPGASYVDGFTPSWHPHVTLLYGLLGSGQTWWHHIDDVLAGWEEPEALTIDQVEMFSNPGSKYAPLVFRLDASSHARVLDAHQRLSLLPHINTFPTYKSHITIGYVQNEYANDVVEFYEDLGLPFDLRAGQLNYGR